MHVEVCRHGSINGTQRAEKLLRVMPPMHLADDTAALDVESGEQVRGAVPDGVVSAAFDLTRPHRQQWLRAIQRLYLRLLVCRQYERAIGRVQVQSNGSRTFSMNSGSFDILKVSFRWGFSMNAPQMRLTVLWLSPVRWAIARVVQCVASFGTLSSVSASTRSTSASRTVRGAPGRGSSSRPSTPRAIKRPRHLPTVCGVRRSRAAISEFDSPWALASTIRARIARAFALVWRRVHRSSVSRSGFESCSGASGRPLGTKSPSGGPKILLVRDKCKLFLTQKTMALSDPKGADGRDKTGIAAGTRLIHDLSMAVLMWPVIREMSIRQNESTAPSYI